MIWKVAFLVLAVLLAVEWKSMRGDMKSLRHDVDKRLANFKPSLNQYANDSGRPGRVVQASAATSAPVRAVRSKPRDDRKFVHFEVVGKDRVAVDGVEYVPGKVTPYGRVKACSDQLVLFDQADTDTGLFWFVNWSAVGSSGSRSDWEQGAGQG